MMGEWTERLNWMPSFQYFSSQGPGDSQAHLGRTSPTKPMPSRGKEMETSQAQRLVPGTVALKDSDHILGRSCLVKK